MRVCVFMSEGSVCQSVRVTCDVGITDRPNTMI